MKLLLLACCFLVPNVQAVRPLLTAPYQIPEDTDKYKENSNPGHPNARGRRKLKSSKSSKSYYKGKGKGKGSPTLADIVAYRHDLDTLQDAFEAAKALYVLHGGEYTLLAPNDQAFYVFAHTYPELYDHLFSKSWQLHLLDLLFTHAIEGEILLSTDLGDGDGLETVSGEEISVVIDDDNVCFEPSLDGQACVKTADIMAKNGVAHIIDGVLSPKWLYFSLYDAVSGVLPTLAELIECAELDDFLANKVGYTLFAPSEDAFAGLSVVDLCAEKALLTEILTYHVIPTVLPSPHIPSGTTYVKTIQGSFLTLHSTDLGTDEAVLKVNDATVISADVGTNNGMIHVIDGVLEPPMGHKGKGKGKGKGTAKGKGKGGSSYKGKGRKSSKSR